MCSKPAGTGQASGHWTGQGRELAPALAGSGVPGEGTVPQSCTHPPLVGSLVSAHAEARAGLGLGTWPSSCGLWRALGTR